MPLLSRSERTQTSPSRRRTARRPDLVHDQRSCAIRALVGQPDAAEVLGARLRVETDLAVRFALFVALVETATPAALGQILPLLGSGDRDLRNAAVDAAQQLPLLVGPAVEALLDNPDPDLRLSGLRILSEVQHPQAVQWLSAVLQHEGDPNVVAAGLDVLAEWGTSDMLASVVAVRNRFAECEFIRYSCDFVASRLRAVDAPAVDRAHSGQ